MWSDLSGLKCYSQSVWHQLVCNVYVRVLQCNQSQCPSVTKRMLSHKNEIIEVLKLSKMAKKKKSSSKTLYLQTLLLMQHDPIRLYTTCQPIAFIKGGGGLCFFAVTHSFQSTFCKKQLEYRKHFHPRKFFLKNLIKIIGLIKALNKNHISSLGWGTLFSWMTEVNIN